MRFLFIASVIVLFSWCIGSCGSSGKAPFCDTACVNTPFEFVHPTIDTPYVKLTMKGCMPDTITWSHKQLATKRKMGFYELVGKDVRLNKNYLSCFFNDTSYAWLKFNDCITGRGFLLKLPYSKTDKWSIYTSALNNYDPKFSVEDGLIAYYDELFIYVQDMATGKLDRMIMSDNKLDIDHNNVHDTFDSVKITRDKIWAQIKVEGKVMTKDKKIKLN